MTIKFSGTFDAEITFDDTFSLQVANQTLDFIIDKIKWAFGEYNFTTASVIDYNTGELLLTVTND